MSGVYQLRRLTAWQLCRQAPFAETHLFAAA